MKITMAHGSGGRATSELIDEIFAKEFNNETLNEMEDSAVVDGYHRIAMTTDSFVVTPLEFPGGDIGRLCICGTVNDLLMRGAIPKYITCGFILEEGAEIDQIKRIVSSMARTAKEAGVTIVAGDTKVVEGNGGIYINTSGVGFVSDDMNISAANCQAGDVIIVSGNLGDHHAVILQSRMEIDNTIQSDNAPLKDMVMNLLDGGIEVHVLRDVTRGGLATVLKEIADRSHCMIQLEETSIPVNLQVKDFCGLLGLDPLYMGNEGKMVAIVSEKDSEAALDIIRNSRYGENAAIIGKVQSISSDSSDSTDSTYSTDSIDSSGSYDCKSKDNGKVVLHTSIGGKRIIDVLYGEGLPRIC